MKFNGPTGFFNIDPLSILIVGLVTCIGTCVASFAARYMRGDQGYRAFFFRLVGVLAAVAITVTANHVGGFLVGWSVSNALLVRLMVHNSAWSAAKAAGRLTARTFFGGTCCMAGGFYLLSIKTGTPFIYQMVRTSAHGQSELWIGLALVLICIGAMTQSATWPFHRWLLSSLNSPTPVSAIMHAGLVNGGGILLIRFSPLLVQYPLLLMGLFWVGLVSAIMGILFKLIQCDVKRVLASSTMGQMGFMIVQCGLGLFSAAVAHLVWHGFIKAYLFLASGNVVQEKRFSVSNPPRWQRIVGSASCGVMGSIAFGYMTGASWMSGSTSVALLVVVFIAGFQLAAPILTTNPFRRLPLTILITVVLGITYGCSVEVISSIVHPLHLMHPQPLSIAYFFGIGALILTWISVFFIQHDGVESLAPWSRLRARLYVMALNAAQPHPSTVTPFRNSYRYQ